MNHKIRYLLFRIGLNVIFHIAWMDERLRSGDRDITATNGLDVRSDDEYPQIFTDDGDSGNAIDVTTVIVRGESTDSDDDVVAVKFETVEQADAAIQKIHEALGEFVRQPLPDTSDQNPQENGPAGFPYNLL